MRVSLILLLGPPLLTLHGIQDYLSTLNEASGTIHVPPQ